MGTSSLLKVIRQEHNISGTIGNEIHSFPRLPPEEHLLALCLIFMTISQVSCNIFYNMKENTSATDFN